MANCPSVLGPRYSLLMRNSMNFVAIDFETANAARSSACSISMVKVENGAIVDTFSSLLRPTADHDFLHSINFAIHGISRDEYMAGPTFPEVADQILEFAGRSTLLAHNASFDRSCLIRTAESWNVDLPNFDWRCTYAMSKKFLDLPYYKLPLVAEHLGLATFTHHDSLADAQACAEIALKLANDNQISAVADFPAPSPARSNRALAGERLAFSQEFGITDYPEENLVEGLNVSFTGTLQLGEREVLLVPLLEALGAAWNKSPKRITDLLVFGDRDPNYLRAGMKKSNKLEKAERLQKELGHIEIIDEATFLSLLPSDIVSRIRAH